MTDQGKLEVVGRLEPAALKTYNKGEAGFSENSVYDLLDAVSTAVPSQSGLDQKHELEDKIGNAHLNLLLTKKLLICLAGTSLSLFVAFCDQTGVTVALPYIARDLKAENTINWAGTASLLANTVFQVFFGRFADIFGRKQVLLACLAVLLILSLLCGFATNGPMFYVFRALAGIGSGGVSLLLMVIMSDVVTLRQRGKFQGILGSMVGIGNAAGPVIMARFALNTTWRNFYRMIPPAVGAIMVIVYFSVDSKKKDLGAVLLTREVLRKIDYAGIFFACASLTLLLIPISDGGSTYKWNSALVISMFTMGGLCFIAFLLVEWKVPELPMIPLGIFRNFSLSLILFQTFLFGMAYFSFLFAIPYYFQLVRGHSVMGSAILTMPLVLMQAAMLAFAGLIITFLGRYFPVTVVGLVFWLTGHGMTLAWNETTSDGILAGTMVMLGTGVGFIFQPTMVAAQANSRKAQRAVVISARNVIRSFGGALGIAVLSLIITSSLLLGMASSTEAERIPDLYLDFMKQHLYSLPEVSKLTPSQLSDVRRMYSNALHRYFYFTVPLLSICLILALFTRDNGLLCVDEPAETKRREISIMNLWKRLRQ